jgi:hypothetical protein
MMRLHYFDIDLKTLEIKSGVIKGVGPGYCGCKGECNCGDCARFNEDGCERVYSESTASAEAARRQALDECRRLKDMFDRASRKIANEMGIERP